MKKKIKPYVGKYVTVETDKSRLRIGLCRSVSVELFSVNQKYLYLNLDDTPSNRILAQEKAMQLDSDIEANQLDLDLNSYLVNKKSGLEIPQASTARILSTHGLSDRESKQLNLDLNPYSANNNIGLEILQKSTILILSTNGLFDQFCEFKKPQLSFGTYKNTYIDTYYGIIRRCPQDLTKQPEIVDYLYTNCGNHNFVRISNCLNTACEWAKKRKLLPVDFENHFLELRKDYKVNHAHRGANMLVLDGKPQYCRDRDHRAFPATDAHCIKGKFHENAVATHTPIKGRPIDADTSYTRESVADFIDVGFGTGARLCEISGLRWKDIADDFSCIAIRNAYNTKQRVLKPLKNELVGQEGTKSRNFPIPLKLRAVLERRKSKFYNGDPNSYVFQHSLNDPTIPLNTNHIRYHWYGCKNNNQNKSGNTHTMTYNGVVTQLFLDGEISIYLSPNAMRHTWITHQLQSGVSVHNVAKLVGNTPQVIWDSYSSVIDDFSPIVEF